MRDTVSTFALDRGCGMKHANWAFISCAQSSIGVCIVRVCSHVSAMVFLADYRSLFSSAILAGCGRIQISRFHSQRCVSCGSRCLAGSTGGLHADFNWKWALGGSAGRSCQAFGRTLYTIDMLFPWRNQPLRSNDQVVTCEFRGR